MRSPIRAQDLDVRDLRAAEVRLVDIAASLKRRQPALSRLADLLFGRRVGHFDRNPLSFDETLALSLASNLVTAPCPPQDAATAARLHWPELARVALEHERARNDAAVPEVRLCLVISGALAPPPLIQAVRQGDQSGYSGSVLDPRSSLSAVRDLLGETAWSSGMGRLARLFGDYRVILPDEGRAREMPTGANFLSEGPYWDRLSAVLRADVPNLFGAKGPAEARRLRCQIEYLLDPPPIDQWKREVGTARALPRVKHLVEAIANAGGVEMNTHRHPRTLTNVDPDDAVETLRGYLLLLEPAGRDR